MNYMTLMGAGGKRVDVEASQVIGVMKAVQSNIATPENPNPPQGPDNVFHVLTRGTMIPVVGDHNVLIEQTRRSKPLIELPMVQPAGSKIWVDPEVVLFLGDHSEGQTDLSMGTTGVIPIAMSIDETRATLEAIEGSIVTS